MGYNQYKRIFEAGTSYLSATDLFVEIDTTLGIATIYLPKISELFALFATNNFYNFNGIRFKDLVGNAAVNNIILKGLDGDLINGLSEVTLNTNGIGGIITPISETDWSLNLNTVSGGASSAVDVFSAYEEQLANIDINDTQEVYGDGYIVLQAGSYTFDCDFEYFPSINGIAFGSCLVELRTNTDTSLIAVAPSDVIQKSKNIFIQTPTYTDGNLIGHIMTGKLTFNAPFVVKVSFVDNADLGTSINKILLRAIKIS
jgi:hypothetical protein